MEKLCVKLIIGSWFIAALLAIPGISISQNSNQNSVDQHGSMTGTAAPGTINMEALGKIREEAENRTDLSESDKKNVQSFLDRAISFGQSELQLRTDIEAIKQRVQAAPERIKMIEAEL